MRQGKGLSLRRFSGIEAMAHVVVQDLAGLEKLGVSGKSGYWL